MQDYQYYDERTGRTYYFLRDGDFGDELTVNCPACGFLGEPKKVSGKLKNFSMDGLDVLALAFGRIQFKYNKIPTHFECPRCGCCFLDVVKSKTSKNKQIKDTIIAIFELVVLLILIVFGIVSCARR